MGEGRAQIEVDRAIAGAVRRRDARLALLVEARFAALVGRGRRLLYFELRGNLCDEGDPETDGEIDLYSDGDEAGGPPPAGGGVLPPGT